MSLLEAAGNEAQAGTYPAIYGLRTRIGLILGAATALWGVIALIGWTLFRLFG